MSTWILAYCAACSERGVLPREELKGDEERESVILNGNCPERFSCKVGDDEVAILCQAISQSSCVKEVDISYNNVGDEGARHLAGLLRRSSSLEYLSLAYNNVTSRGWRLIAQALMENTSLLGLNIAGNSITGDDPTNREFGGKVIGMLLAANTTLQYLNFKSCGLGVNSLVGIAQSMLAHPSVVSLNLASPLLPSLQDRMSVAHHLAEMLKKNTVLQELDLSRSMLDDSQLQVMLPAFVCNDPIRSLLLGSNKMSQDGGVEVSKLLARRHDLAVVDISSNEIQSKGAVAIASTLRANQGIMVLHMAYCKIAEEGLIALAEGLRDNSSITTLSLWGNQWSPKACSVFYSIKTRLEELIEFDCEFQVVDGEPQVLLAEGGGVRG